MPDRNDGCGSPDPVGDAVRAGRRANRGGLGGHRQSPSAQFPGPAKVGDATSRSASAAIHAPDSDAPPAPKPSRKASRRTRPQACPPSARRATAKVAPAGFPPPSGTSRAAGCDEASRPHPRITATSQTPVAPSGDRARKNLSAGPTTAAATHPADRVGAIAPTANKPADETVVHGDLGPGRRDTAIADARPAGRYHDPRPASHDAARAGSHFVVWRQARGRGSIPADCTGRQAAHTSRARCQAGEPWIDTGRRRQSAVQHVAAHRATASCRFHAGQRRSFGSGETRTRCGRADARKRPDATPSADRIRDDRPKRGRRFGPPIVTQPGPQRAGLSDRSRRAQHPDGCARPGQPRRRAGRSRRHPVHGSMTMPKASAS
jgi:ribonuclease E